MFSSDRGPEDVLMISDNLTWGALENTDRLRLVECTERQANGKIYMTLKRRGGTEPDHTWILTG